MRSEQSKKKEEDEEGKNIVFVFFREDQFFYTKNCSVVLRVHVGKCIFVEWKKKEEKKTQRREDMEQNGKVGVKGIIQGNFYMQYLTKKKLTLCFLGFAPFRISTYIIVCMHTCNVFSHSLTPLFFLPQKLMLDFFSSSSLMFFFFSLFLTRQSVFCDAISSPEQKVLVK